LSAPHLGRGTLPRPEELWLAVAAQPGAPARAGRAPPAGAGAGHPVDRRPGATGAQARLAAPARGAQPPVLQHLPTWPALAHPAPHQRAARPLSPPFVGRAGGSSKTVMKSAPSRGEGEQQTSPPLPRTGRGVGGEGSSPLSRAQG